MGLFGGGNHNIYKDNDKERARARPRTPSPKSCGRCGGSGEKTNSAGRAIGGKCKACKGTGGR